MSQVSTDWKEVYLDSSQSAEEELFQGYALEIEAQQQEVRTPGDPIRRGFHAKIHAGSRAKFHVLDDEEFLAQNRLQNADLLKEVRHGVFREGGKTFAAVVRFSNGEPILLPDERPEPRGIAIKLWGVEGPKLLPEQESANTQDFLATSHSVTATVRNVKQFMAFIRAARDRVTLPITLERDESVGVLEAARILFAFGLNVGLSKVHSLVTEHYSSTAPIKLGPNAIKFTIQPTEETQPAVHVDTSDANFLRKELADRLRTGDVVLDFCIQFFHSEKETPIEDTSKHWEPSVSPLIKVAQVRIAGGDLDDRLTETVDSYSFTPWHTTEEHRPLGNIMRARKVAYLASAKFRNAAPEPTAPP